ncbi:MAG TPA: Crp/Fnr family transcriptional regulator [Anaerolineaceae bacterium]|nr:Crp/Fnr family transcriptional regulator [Anaerolineaceae bacterium]
MLGIDQIRRYPFFKGLNEAELQALAAGMTKRAYHKNAYIYHQGNPAVNMYLIESGLVRLFFCNPAGDEFILNLMRPGDAIGHALTMDSQIRLLGAAAQLPTVLLCIPGETLLGVLETSRQLALNLAQEFAVMQKKLLLHYQAQVLVGLEGRTALLLLHIGEGEKDELDLPISQSELAGWLGVSRGRLNGAITRFQKLGLIRLEGSRVTILDRPGLARLAEGWPETEL